MTRRLREKKMQPNKANHNNSLRSLGRGKPRPCLRRYRAVSKYGALTGVMLIFRRFKSCSVALQKLEKENPKDENPKKKRDEGVGKCLVLEGIGEVACCSALSIFG